MEKLCNPRYDDLYVSRHMQEMSDAVEGYLELDGSRVFFFKLTVV